MDSHVIAGFLDQESISVRSGGHCAYPLMKHLGIDGAVRLSFYVYNTKEEINIFIEALKLIISKKLI